MPEVTAPQLEFDVDKYVRNSKKVDISDIDLSQAAACIHCGALLLRFWQSPHDP